MASLILTLNIFEVSYPIRVCRCTVIVIFDENTRYIRDDSCHNAILRKTITRLYMIVYYLSCFYIIQPKIKNLLLKKVTTYVFKGPNDLFIFD